MVAFRVLMGFFGVGEPLYFEFLRCSLLWLALPCFCGLTLFDAYFGLFCVCCLYMWGAPSLFWHFFIYDFIVLKKKKTITNEFYMLKAKCALMLFGLTFYSYKAHYFF